MHLITIESLVLLLFTAHVMTTSPNNNGVVKGIAVIGGRGSPQSIELYNPGSGSTLSDIQLPFALSVCAGAHQLNDGQILAIDSNFPPSGRSMVIDLCKKEVVEGPPMNHKRSLASSTQAGGAISVCGGEDTSHDLDPDNNCESSDGDSWSNTGQSMQESRSSHSLTALSDGTILAIGGQNSSGGIRSTSELLQGSAWTTIGARLIDARRAHSAVLNKELNLTMVCGGSGRGFGEKLAVLRSCEIMDTTKRAEWRQGPFMNWQRQKFAMLEFNDVVYAIGGTSNQGKPRNPVSSSVESYKWGMWQTEPHPLEHARDGHCAVAVDMQC